MSSFKSTIIALKQIVASSVSRRWNSLTWKFPAHAFRALSRTSFSGGYFLFDVFLQSLTTMFILTALGTNGPTFLSADSVAWQYSNWYIVCWALAAGSWAFGYMERAPRVYWYHLVFACMRTAFCLVSAALFFQYSIDIRLRGAYEPPLILGIVILAALLHLKLASDRVHRHRKLQAKGHMNPTDYRINLMTSTAMTYWTGPLHRSQDVDHAVRYMISTPDEQNRFWYHPLVRIAHKEGTKNRQRPTASDGAVQALGLPLFSRCYCCLDNDQDSKAGASQHSMLSNNEDTEMQTAPTRWAEQRDLFLQQPQQGHPAQTPGLDDADDLLRSEENFTPHQLCKKCTHMAENSFLIQLMSGWTWATYRKLLFLAVRTEPFVEEIFEHWSTAVQMRNQVERGCHLCTMLWSTMSKEQQTQLISHDFDLEREMARKIEQLGLDGNNSDVEFDRVKVSYHRQRRITIKMRSPSAHKDWADSWGGRHSYQSLRLIPHFGGNNVARRWMKEKFARRAIALGQDPALDWDQEQVDGLEIASMMLDNRGPICIPMSINSGSDASVKLIRSWIWPKQDFQDTATATAYEQQEQIDPDIALQFLDQDGGRARAFRTPTRLIDVGAIESDTVCLRLSSTMEREDWLEGQRGTSHSSRYVALSHSWGFHKILCLTESSLHEFQAGMPLSSLPPTFRDAISVVRRIGLRLLWIDSLCIIQDSKEDWRREADQMKDIYSNADFVIAAAASWTSSESFFVPQIPLAANPCLLGVRGQLSGLTANAPRSFGGIYVFPQLEYTEASWDEIYLSRLYSRAWCYQEERLAKRIVWFGDRQIQMKELTRSGELLRRRQQVDWISIKDTEYRFPDLLHPPLLQATATVLRQKLPSWPMFRSIDRWSSRQLSRAPIEASTQGQGEPVFIIPARDDSPFDHRVLIESWWDGVRQYTERYLTHDEDKLQAFSGIALRFKSRMLAQNPEVQYLAGLWGNGNDYLATSLLWYVSRHLSGSKKGQYRAPSWSWASVDGRVRNDSLPGCCAAGYTGIQVIQYGAEGPSVDSRFRTAFPMGQCTGGFIVVRGKLQSATSAVLEQNQKRYYVARPGEDDYVRRAADLQDFAPWSSDPVSGPEGYALLAQDGTRVGYLLPDAEDYSPGEVYCLQVVVKPVNQVDQDDFAIPWATRGLALEMTDLAPNEFCRIGYFELDKTLGGLSFPHRFASDRQRARRRPPPNIDMVNFFVASPECEIVIR